MVVREAIVKRVESPVSLYVVSTPIGNLGDITLRALETLRAVDVTYAEDTRRTRRLFDHFEISGELRSLHEHNERDRTNEVLARLNEGASVALVSDAGTPLISDPGYLLVRAAIEAGITVIPIPGASSVSSALVVSGLPTDAYTFLGFVPRKGKARKNVLHRVAGSIETVVLFEAPGRLVALLNDLERVLGTDRAIAVARELTKLHETVFRGTAAEAVAFFAENPPRGEITVVVGPDPNAGTETPSSEELSFFAREQIDAGNSRSETVDAIRVRFGLRRNEAYRVVHELGD